MALAELVGRYTQSHRLLRLTTTLGADLLLAECVRGEEEISGPFTLTISALSLDTSIQLRSLLGKPALLELLTSSDNAFRPFHGYVTAAEASASNGGMARYQLTVQPWIVFAGLGRDSRTFHDKSVIEILDIVFSAYQLGGKLAASWRFALTDASIYPKRSLTTQYQESSLAFAQRLMSEEGLFYFFEHAADARSPGLGSHTMVIADNNEAFAANEYAVVRFTQPGAVMKEDSIDRWRSEAKLQTNGISLQSWDYRTRSSRPVSARGASGNDPPLICRDVPGAYAYPDRAHGQRIANINLEAMEAHRHSYTGAGTVRTSAPGTIFTLDGHPVQDADSSDGAREFLITRVVHLMHNNLSADMQSAVEKNIGVSALLELMIAEQSGLHAVGADKGERPVYRNRIDAIKAHNPFRAARTDAQGRLLYPRPVMSGQQTAIVVGPAGAPIYTDRDHRVKVQFHWQRDAGGGTAHSRLAHPHPDGQAGAAADDTAGTWVRVAVNLAPVAGANWGGNAIPRVGQEVLVDFMEGDIDRPVVIGALYNGRGETDGQSNLIGHGAGAATGNAPTWFAGEKDAHAHPAVLSGLKGQSLDASQGGAGAYSQLVFDDSPGQSRVSLQHYTKPHAGTSELNLGHLRHQGDNQLLDTTGFGVELKTDHSVALRAGKGLLITTDGRARASSSQLDAGEAQSQIVESHALQESLATAAQSHNATIKESSGEAAPTPKNLPAIAALGGSGKAIESADEGGSAGDPAAGGQGKATAFAQPQLQLSSPHGIVAATPASVSIAAGDTSSLTAGQDINFASQGNHFNIVGNGISLFTLGNVSNHRAGDETGIKLHAATGKVSSQSQSGETKITADKAITVSSVTKSVSVAAKQHVLLASQGAYLKLEGGNIMLHGPGKIEFKASKKDLAGPASSSPTLPQMPQSSDLKNYIELNYRWDDMQPMVGAPYKILFDTGTSIEGKLDANGFARIENTPSVGAVVTFGEDERDAIIRHKRPANVVYGAVPKSEEEADAILAAYLAQEEAYYEDNYFPDEIEAMVNGDDFGEESVLEYDFHYDDYRYEDEDSPEDHAAEQSYRDIHGPAGEEP